MKILVVDDSNEKIDKIIRSFDGRAGVSRTDVSVAYTIFDARTALHDTTFDLLVLDVMMPLRPGDPPRSESTVTLMTELRDRDNLRKPRHIIGLTAYDEALRELEPIFAQQAWTIIKYSTETTEWSEQLARSVEWIASSSQQPAAVSYNTAACIVTALDAPEYDALVRNGWAWDAPEPLDDTTFYRKGTFTSGGTSYAAVAAHSPRMGMVTAALLASKLIEAMRPKCLAMAGICAAVKTRANYGDPIIADPCWDWQSGKHVLKEGEREFEIAPDQIPVPEQIRARWEQFKGDRAFWADLKEAWPGPPDTDLRVRLGPSVSGSSVLANAEILAEIRQQHRALVGLEMEAYGVLSAARMASAPRPMTFSCKSVCDFADDKKDDRWQTYAAYTSARAVTAFFERYMHELDVIVR